MIEFQGKFDENVTKNLNKHQIKKMWWIYLAVSLIFIVMGIVGIFFGEDNSDLSLGIYCVILGVLFTPLAYLLTLLIQKNVNKSMSILSAQTIETYKFYPDRLVITQTKGDEYEAVTNARYSYLYRVEETRDRYFLKISKTQSHVVNKADLTQGTIEELNELLASNLGIRFKPQR